MPAELGDGAEVRGIAPPCFPGLGVNDVSGLLGVSLAPGFGFALSIVIIKLLPVLMFPLGGTGTVVGGGIIFFIIKFC